MIHSAEGRSLDAGREPVGNEGEIGTDYIRGPRERNWVVGSQILTPSGYKVSVSQVWRT